MLSGGTSRSPSSGREKTTTGGFFGLGGGGGGAWAWAWGRADGAFESTTSVASIVTAPFSGLHAAGDLKPLAGVAPQARVEAPPGTLRLLPGDPDRVDVVLQHPVRRAPPARGRQVAEEVLAAELPQDRHHLAVVARGLRDELLERHGRLVAPGLLLVRRAQDGPDQHVDGDGLPGGRGFLADVHGPGDLHLPPHPGARLALEVVLRLRHRVDAHPLAERAAQRVGRPARSTAPCRAGPACARPCRRRTPASGSGRRARPRPSSRTASRSPGGPARRPERTARPRERARRGRHRLEALWRRPMPEYRHKGRSPGKVGGSDVAHLTELRIACYGRPLRDARKRLWHRDLRESEP